MSKNLITYPFAVALTLAILLVPAGDAAAQSQIPIEVDDFVASVVVGSEVRVVPLAMKDELEAATQQPASVHTMGQLLTLIPPATATNGVHFEGGFPAASTVPCLTALGYVTERLVVPELISSGIAVLRSQ